MASGNTNPDTAMEDEEEWEYEYHPTETDTFYVTLDLPNQTEKGDSSYYFHSRRTRPTLQKTAGDADEIEQQDDDDRQNDEETEVQSSQDAKPPIQILGLESNEPVVSYKGQVFRCSWQTAVGTDMIFAAPNDSPADIEPLISDPSFNLLATTNIKLVGQPVNLIEKEKQTGQIEEPENGVTARINGTQSFPQDSEADISQANHKPYSILLEQTPSQSRKRQASFLENLMTAKVARGDTDEVYIGQGKQYVVQGEAKPREGRRVPASLADKGDDDQETQRKQRPERKQRTYKKRLRGPKATSARGGLFRDFGMGESAKDTERNAPETGPIDGVAPQNGPDLVLGDIHVEIPDNQSENIPQGIPEQIPANIPMDLPEDLPEDYFHAWPVDPSSSNSRKPSVTRAKRGKPRGRARGRPRKQLQPRTSNPDPARNSS